MKRIKDVLRDMGVPASMPRICIYDYLLSQKTHPSADMVYMALHPQMPSLSRTTVYNTLRMLCDKGLVKQIPICEGDMRFDADVSEHGHFWCRKCGRVIDIDAPHIATKQSHKMIGDIDEIQVVLIGSCNECKES
ncbi:MAG: transcriptional repressor [Kiritimatiellae bacterium]|nr:transcriptional repressor [Kiritimatiellia bacterium]MBQ2282057.1 transcriptional repressor [Kiritimatiellia bacterium]